MTTELLYRALSPGFSHAPLSGRGAELSGGRWNAVGTPALYLACDVVTAILEYQQRASFKPVTAVQYRLKDARLADLADPAIHDRYGVTQDILFNNWQLLVGLGKEPPSWPVAAAIRNDSYHGLRYRSRLNGGTCVVLWAWNAPDAPSLEANDPDKRLPRNQNSWLA